MTFPHITAVISFCSNDWRFLAHCIDGVAPICRQIIITVCDHFFDGSPEHYALLEEAFQRFPQCQFLEFAFDPNQTYRYFSPIYPEHPDWRHEWHNTGRSLSYFYCAQETEFLLFLDCDEIIDSQAFLSWLSEIDLHRFSALRFACFNHFREARFEALAQDDFSLLVNKAFLHPDFLWDVDERMGLFHRLDGEKHLQVKGKDGQPMIRHYSGVRTQEELIKKCTTWGHHWERPWENLIKEEFSRPFNGTDFVRKYRYHEITPIFDPLSIEIPQLPPHSLEQHLKNLPRFSNVHMVSKEEIFKRQLAHDFSLFLSCHH
jgi:hypothetical protein